MENSDHSLSVKTALGGLRKGFNSGVTKSYESRVSILKQLKQSIQKHASEMQAALRKDLGRNEFLANLSEIEQLTGNIDYHLKNLKTWMQPETRDLPALLAPGSAYVWKQPYGVALVMGSWNFPFATTLNPVIGALAAGNCVCIKPSEISSSTSQVMQAISEEMPQEIMRCLQGGADLAVALTSEKWDVIAFTGSPEKGKLVAEAAAKNLTPVLLELGGKNPAFVDENVDLETAVMRILQGRFLNNGQLCLSPEVVFVKENKLKQFVDCCKKVLTQFYGEDPSKSDDYGRIVNEFHTKRVLGLIENSGGEVLVGGRGDPKEKFIEPTIILKPDLSSSISTTEIFGPVLLVHTYSQVEDFVSFVNERERPLALYYFGNNSKNKEKIKQETTSGHFSSNECALNYTCYDIPFGGVGNSGISMMFSKNGFDAMSHQKSVLEKGRYNGYPVSLRYPPYTIQKTKTFYKVKALTNFTVKELKCGLKWVAGVATLSFVSWKFGLLDLAVAQVSSFSNYL